MGIDMDNIQVIVKKQRKYFGSGATRPLDFRRKQLLRLRQAIRERQTAISLALREDLNKAPFEAYETEIGIVLEEIGYLIRKLNRFAAPKRVRTPLTNFPARSTVYKEPYGVTLIMSPWNYPFHLTLMPLAGAIAAGNCAVVKPSAYSPATSAVIGELLGEIYHDHYVAVVEGGREANQTLLRQKFDYIFFTGSVAVGRTVMASAARNLTPVTLELGGKSPCIVDRTANIPLAAKRIVWGKFLNAGQTCVAPDYVLVEASVQAELIRELKKAAVKLYGEEPLSNPDYPRIINRRHFDRLCGLLRDEHVLWGGERDGESNRIAPAFLRPSGWDSPVMREEIFGPILPILPFNRIEDAVAAIASRPRPLALYLFTSSRKTERYVVGRVSYGGGCVNDTVAHLANSHLPFGGVGESGMGSYHGKASFDTFSHEKGVMRKSALVDIPLRYPPFGNHLGVLTKVLK